MHSDTDFVTSLFLISAVCVWKMASVRNRHKHDRLRADGRMERVLRTFFRKNRQKYLTVRANAWELLHMSCMAVPSTSVCVSCRAFGSQAHVSQV